MTDQPPQTKHLRDYQPSPWLADETRLDVSLDDTRTRVTATYAMRRNPASRETDAPLVLDGEALELVDVKVAGKTLSEADYEVDDSHLTIVLPPGDAFDLSITAICNPKANTALSGLYLSNGVFCTQCEAEGFRRIAYSLDRPDVLSRYEVRIDADNDACPVLLSNGNLVATGVDADTGRHWAHWRDPFPKPSYLFALVAGDLAHVEDRFTTRSGREVVLRIYVEPGKEDRCAWAMKSLKTAMKWDEDVFGREYDLDIFMIVAVSDFNMGAMENKGLNVFNDKYILADAATATDQDFANIEAIIAHEYFHNWTGNRITCRDWFQLCLKEGLTVFRDQEFTSDVRSRPVKRIADVRTLRAHQFPEDAGPLAHPVRPDSYIEINNFYTATVYEKGAEVIRMLKELIGDDAFHRGMDLYFDRHDGQAVTMEDFIACMAQASGRDLGQFFRWYEQAGTPEVTAAGHYNRARRTFRLDLTQTVPDTPGQSDKAPHVIPLKLGLVAPDGSDMALTVAGERLNHPVIELDESAKTIVFEDVRHPPALSLNRGFTAPIKLTTNTTAAERLRLLRADADAFNRWEAGQVLARDIILDTMQALAQDDAPPDVSPFAEALGAVIDDDRLEPAFIAQMLAFPSETDLAGAIGEDVDPDAIHVARERFRADLARALMPRLDTLWRTAADDQATYSPDAASAGRRAVRHAALALLAAAEPDRYANEALAHYRAAAHMSDRAGALATLCRLDHAARDEALADFRDRFADDPLIIDKWFTFHAQWPHPASHRHIHRLMSDDAFSLTRPNCVRALIGAFAQLNAVGFHAADGGGYDLVCDVIARLDRINPQVAARLAQAFRSWRGLEPGRRRLIEQRLEALKNKRDLSTDVYEIVTRTLA